MARILVVSLALLSTVCALKIEHLEEIEHIKSAELLDYLFANNDEDINNYLDLSDYRANRTLNVIRQEMETTYKVPRDNEPANARIARNGYPVEVHHVTTEDGYILEMHRIPSSPKLKSNQTTKKQPVFLMHGLLDSSAGWVLMDQNQSLAYVLADLGYDVWMGNARGNQYSRRHIKLSPNRNHYNRRQFWSFSWHEIGYYDLPAMIDYVLAVNQDFKKLHYIGFSQGTTSFFVMASERPEYNEKILLMNALAPVAFMTNVKSPVGRPVAILLQRVEAILQLIGQLEFLPGNSFLNVVAKRICHSEVVAKYMCSNILFMIGGFNSKMLDIKKLPTILSYLPAGAAVRQVIHYGQLMQNDKFARYDFGTYRNKRIYGRPDPPSYNLNNISAPVALHYGFNDMLADVVDVRKLGNNLPNLVGFFPVADPRCNHFDFIWASSVRTMIYDKVIDLMKRQEKIERFHSFLMSSKQ